MPHREHSDDPAHPEHHDKETIREVHALGEKLKKHGDIDNPYALAWWLEGHHRLRKAGK